VKLKIQTFRANNPGVMTGSGTNTYFLGEHHQYIIDPGPLDDDHLNALMKYAQNTQGILLTHFHKDHADLASLLASKLNIPIIACMPGPFDRTDIHIDIMLKDGMIFDIDGTYLKAIHTPGHAQSHYCFLAVEDQALFTGDHLMQGSTVVINPPDGDLNCYLESLKKLLKVEIKMLYPGHGMPIENANLEINKILNHRLSRETKILNHLSKDSLINIDDLTKLTYQDRNQSIYPIAKRTLLAHLLKLKSEGKVKEENDQWRLS
jgi:glyoxylase-like metal-dependent hydrolase (beta-lactamase superfamily II)